MSYDELITKFLDRNYSITSGSEYFLVLDKLDGKLWDLLNQGFHWHLRPIFGGLDKPDVVTIDRWVEVRKKEYMVKVDKYLLTLDVSLGSRVLEQQMAWKYEHSKFQPNFIENYFNDWYYKTIMVPKFEKYMSGVTIQLGPRSWLPYKVNGSIVDIKKVFSHGNLENNYQEMKISKHFDEWMEKKVLEENEKIFGKS